MTMDEVERRYITRILKQLDGNKTMAADVLGLDRRTLYRKLDRWGAADDANGANAPATTTDGT
jgi:DNA-binding NtrC family response regulator